MGQVEEWRIGGWGMLHIWTTSLALYVSLVIGGQTLIKRSVNQEIIYLIGNYYNPHQDLALRSSSSVMRWKSRMGRMRPQQVGVSNMHSLRGVNIGTTHISLAVSVEMAFRVKLLNEWVCIVCNGQDAETCLGTYNTSQSYWTNTTVDNADRSWEWIV